MPSASPSRGPPVLASDWLSWPLPGTKTYSRPAGQVPRTPPHGNAMDRKLLDILVCPATRQPLSLLDKPGIEALNRAIAAGGVTRADDTPQAEPLRQALVTRDRQTVSRVADGIPDRKSTQLNPRQ